MTTLITVLHVTTCFLLVLLVLIQSGKGAEISASLGGSSQTVFGSSGGANFFTRFTGALAAIFMCTSVTLTVLKGGNRGSVFEGSAPAATAPVAPTAPGASATKDAPTAPGVQNTAPAAKK